MQSSFHLRVEPSGAGARLTWASPYSGTTRAFYTVLRSPAVYPDPSGNGERKVIEGVACRARMHGASVQCDLVMDRIGTSVSPRWTDRPPRGRWSYRVGLSANWLNDRELGDLLLVSTPVTVTSR